MRCAMLGAAGDGLTLTDFSDSQMDAWQKHRISAAAHGAFWLPRCMQLKTRAEG